MTDRTHAFVCHGGPAALIISFAAVAIVFFWSLFTIHLNSHPLLIPIASFIFFALDPASFWISPPWYRYCDYNYLYPTAYHAPNMYCYLFIFTENDNTN